MPREDVPASDQAAPTLRSEALPAACSSASFRRAPTIEIIGVTPESGTRPLAGAAREVAAAPVREVAAAPVAPPPRRAPRPSMLGVIGEVVRVVGTEALVAVAAAARPRRRWI